MRDLSPQCRNLLDAVEEAYRQFDQDHALLERALDLSSQELLQANSDMRAVIQAFPDMFLWLDREGKVLACRGRVHNELLRPDTELLSQSIQGLPDPVVAASFDSALQAVNAGEPLVTVEFALSTRADPQYFEARLLRLDADSIIAIVRNITAHRQTERQLAQSVSLLQATLESTADGILVVDSRGAIVSFNRQFVELWGIPDAILASRSDDQALAFVLDQLAEPDAFLAKVHELYGSPDAESFDELLLNGNRVLERYSRPQYVDGRSCGRVWSFRDVTARRQAESALRRSEEELRQAQKMKAIGQLAGGVAHDFNNILTAVIGYSELLMLRLDAASPHRREVAEILRATQRAAGLTQQLLAFSRQQVLSPRTLNLSRVVEETSGMLGRLIGEDISLITVLSPDLGHVRADPVQIEQVILNLSINARDALPRGGRILIETADVTVDEPFSETHDRVPLGPYVMLVVSDDGDGMDRETLQRVFEPFFTTKELGKGTGLGLATVYGIVKQSGGWIWIESEVGHGTTVRIYLPRVQSNEGRRLLQRAAARPGGTETILLVEDDDAVRRLTRDVLAEAGYRLLTARDGADALAVAAGHAGPIELIFTDIVMPGLSGRETAERIEATRPGILTLYMSGYTDDAVIRSGALTRGTDFIQKPFSHDALLRGVRSVLDSRCTDGAGSRAA